MLDAGHLTAEFPEKLGFLFEPMRYKVAYGGRGSSKSWSFARALVIIAAQRPVRVLCAREMQNSIRQSVHALLVDQIQLLGLGHLFDCLTTEIRGHNGSLFTFSGLGTQTVESIKSIEGTDICWVEEAQSVSKRSWDILIPTIRKPNSEIWVSFNPDLPTDDTYFRFIDHPPPKSVVVKVNWSDNPWFPDELAQERDHLRDVDYAAYLNVWEGECKTIIAGAVYKAELEKIRTDGRVTSLPVDPALRVTTVWDLGVRDATTIWFIQQHGAEVRVVDYYEATGEGLPHYIGVLDKKGYLYGKHWAPHDISVRELGTGKSRLEIAESLGLRFEIVPSIPLVDGIHAARMLLSRCWFDSERTKRGVECLSNYRREFNEKMGVLKAEPVHDWASHAADAFRYVAVCLSDPIDAKTHTPTNRRKYRGANSWMG